MYQAILLEKTTNGVLVTLQPWEADRPAVRVHLSGPELDKISGLVSDLKTFDDMNRQDQQRTASQQAPNQPSIL